MYGMVWCGVVRYGMVVWYGMVWYGMYLSIWKSLLIWISKFIFLLFQSAWYGMVGVQTYTVTASLCITHNRAANVFHIY